MRHRLSGLSTYGLNGQCLGDEHPAYAQEGHGPLYLYLYVAGLSVITAVCTGWSQLQYYFDGRLSPE